MNNLKEKKIVFLCIELTGYTICVLDELKKNGYKIYVFSRSQNKENLYKVKSKYKLNLYNKDNYKFKDLKNFIKNINPELLVCHGWIYKEYLLLARFYKNSGGLVMLGFDTPWKNSIKQNIWKFFINLISVKTFSSYAWVPGIYQYEYARKLGFSKNEVIMNSYSADLNVFNTKKIQRDFSSEKILLFVGRLDKVKGIDKLINSWLSIRRKSGWKLKIVGSGKYKVKKSKSIIQKDFIQPSELINEFANSHAFILPSIYEPWGVVLHEAAASGLPLIASKEVGAASCFLINNFNGFLFSHCDKENNLAMVLKKIINISAKDLESFSFNSVLLSKKITPQITAAGINSIL